MLQDQMTALVAACEATTEPQRQLELAKEAALDADRAVTDAICDYNQARFRLIVRAIVDEKLGWCMESRHLASEAQLLGMIESYREYDLESTRTLTCCRVCAERMGKSHASSTQTRRNLMEIDIVATWSEAIHRYEETTLKAFIRDHGIPEPITSMSLGPPRRSEIKQGEVAIATLPWSG